MPDPETHSISIQQPHHNTSWMGVIEGASRYFGLPWNSPEIFVYSGHAFVTNVRNDLCPSGPYAWNVQPVKGLLGNLGITLEDIGFVIASSATTKDRQNLNAAIQDALDGDKVVGLENLDHQLIKGYDGTSYVLCQPWDEKVESTPSSLPIDEWGSFDNDVPIHAYSLHKSEFGSEQLKPAIQFAIDCWHTPKNLQVEPEYGTGPEAYSHWIEGINKGFGADHGAWWNGVVWAECKTMAADFFEQHASEVSDEKRLGSDIAMNYRIAAAGMMTASDKSKSDTEKIRALERANLG